MCICDNIDESRWKVYIGISKKGFQQLSFINNCIWTRRGGLHVNNVLKSIAEYAFKREKKKLPSMERLLMRK